MNIQQHKALEDAVLALRELRYDKIAADVQGAIEDQENEDYARLQREGYA